MGTFMWRALVMALLALGWTGAATAQAPKPPRPQIFGLGPNPDAPKGAPLWWHAGSAGGQAAIRACLTANRTAGTLDRCMIPPETCVAQAAAPDPDDDRDHAGPLDFPGGVRACWWAYIDDWEQEMARSLSWLHANGYGEALDQNQKAWEASMLSDVGMWMSDTGGSMSGMLGARIRARQTAQRVLFLEDLRSFDDEPDDGK